MSEHIAIKQLSASDLMLFDSHFKRDPVPVSNQKCINLNADPLTRRFYPRLAILAKAGKVAVPVEITMLGPGLYGPYRSKKAVTKEEKNWRLNGSTLPDPGDEPGRFDRLRKGDVAIMHFRGGDLPEAITIALVSAADDPDLHAALPGPWSRAIG